MVVHARGCINKEKTGLAVTPTNFEMGVAVLEQKYLRNSGFQNKT